MPGYGPADPDDYAEGDHVIRWEEGINGDRAILYDVADAGMCSYINIDKEHVVDARP